MSETKLYAKRHNEQWKLTATLLNTLAAALLVGAFITPYFNDAAKAQPVVWFFVAIIVHLAARIVLQVTLKSED